MHVSLVLKQFSLKSIVSGCFRIKQLSFKRTCPLSDRDYPPKQHVLLYLKYLDSESHQQLQKGSFLSEQFQYHEKLFVRTNQTHGESQHVSLDTQRKHQQSEKGRQLVRKRLHEKSKVRVSGPRCGHFVKSRCLIRFASIRNQCLQERMNHHASKKNMYFGMVSSEKILLLCADVWLKQLVVQNSEPWQCQEYWLCFLARSAKGWHLGRMAPMNAHASQAARRISQTFKRQ